MNDAQMFIASMVLGFLAPEAPEVVGVATGARGRPSSAPVELDHAFDEAHREDADAAEVVEVDGLAPSPTTE